MNQGYIQSSVVIEPSAVCMAVYVKCCDPRTRISSIARSTTARTMPCFLELRVDH